MKRIIPIGLLLAVVCWGCGEKDTPKTEPGKTNPPKETVQNPPPEPTKMDEKEIPWKKHVSQAGGFAVELPTEPKEKSQDAPSPEGIIKVMNLSAELPDKTVLQVTVSTFPLKALKGIPSEQRLDSVLDRLAASFTTQLQNEEKIKLGKYPGRSADFLTPGKGRAFVRCFVVGPKTYNLMVLGPEQGLGAKVFQKFFDSFSLLKP